MYTVPFGHATFRKVAEAMKKPVSLPAATAALIALYRALTQEHREKIWEVLYA